MNSQIKEGFETQQVEFHILIPDFLSNIGKVTQAYIFISETKT